MGEWRKTIPEARDRAQSAVLVSVVGVALAAACVPVMLLTIHPHNLGYWALRAGIVSLTFAVAVWALRAATPIAAVCGGMICLLITVGTEDRNKWPEVRSGLTPLMTLFLLTFAATTAGRTRKVKAGLAESSRGRNAAQVTANLGAAGLVVIANRLSPWDASWVTPAMLLATLAEATADTVSSEIGAAFGGAPYLLTTWRRVPPGTDGAVSGLGTAAGVGGALALVAAGVWALEMPWRVGACSLAGGVAGLLFDSLLGATLERRGWLGNDLVNFSSTLFAAGVALLAALFCPHF